MEGISLNKYLKIILKDWKLIAYFAAGMLLLSIIYGIFFFKPVYKATAKVLVKSNTPTTFVTPLAIDDSLSSINPNRNPILTQIEIISSLDMAKKVYNKLSNEPSFIGYTESVMSKALQNSIELDNPPLTDIIKIDVKWPDAFDAMKITKAYLDSYFDYNVSVNKKSVTQMKTYIEEQLKKSIDKLSNIKDQIKNYRRNVSSIDIQKEASSIIDQIATIENAITETQGQLQQDARKSSELSSKLGIDISKAIRSQALGQNTNLSSLKQNLTEIEQKYASLNVKYPPTNPQMKQMEANITEIKKQIESQTKDLIGKSDKDRGIIIADPVRTDMVNNLVKSHVEAESLKSKKSSLEKVLSDLNNRKKILPERERTISSLLEEEKNLTSIVEVLNSKLIEAKIKESEIVSNINIVESPEVPQKQSFPTLVHLIAILTLLGVLLGVATVLGKYYVEDICQGVEELEDILKTTVFGVIPWLVDSSYKKSDSGYNPASIIGIIYQKIISTLKIKCYKKNINVIAFSSAELQKKRSIISASVAKTLANSGHNVLIIDADFRDGLIAKEFNIDTSKSQDLTELLISLNKLDQDPDKETIIPTLIEQHTMAVPDNPKLFFIPNNNILANPYELITSSYFPDLINRLKTKYDFVLLDTPPILAVPDTIAISQYIDGLVIICGIKTSHSALRKIKKLSLDNYVELLGIIARDTTTELEVPENQYIKQLSN